MYNENTTEYFHKQAIMFDILSFCVIKKPHIVRYEVYKSCLSQDKERRRPTLPHKCSTIGAIGLNFSVRYGKR
jgi:hypothetical protein